MEQNNKQTEGKTTQEITKVKKKNFFICNFFKYLFDRKFNIVWFFFFLCLVTSLLGSNDKCWIWNICRIGLLFFLSCFIIFLFHKPLNVVYGLIGTKGHISTYLILLVVINVIFSWIYQLGFFSKAGITYDMNQPYVSYNLYNKFDKSIEVLTCNQDTTFIQTSGRPDSCAFFVEKTECKYQPVRYQDVLKNTLMTSLMQEPCDFFAIACTYNDIEDGIIIIRTNDELRDTGVHIRYYNDQTLSCELCDGYDRQKCELFYTLLLLQVFISWIFFGVFISILYNKFRYES